MHALGDDEVRHRVVEVADVAGRGRDRVLLGGDPARQARVAERVGLRAALLDVHDELAAVDHVHRGDGLLRLTVRRRRRLDLVCHEGVLAPHGVDQRTHRQGLAVDGVRVRRGGRVLGRYPGRGRVQRCDRSHPLDQALQAAVVQAPLELVAEQGAQ